jgi:CRISPR/Cas system CMR-associated protein Cmr5 small subunit
LDSLPEGQSGIFCLTSPYLDDRVQDSRNKFKIHETNPSKDAPVVFVEIKDELRKLLNSILLEKFPETHKEFTDRQELAVEKFPHLSRYIKKIDSLTMSESEMLKQAEKEFIAETKLARKEVIQFTEKIKKDKNFDEKAYQEITRHFTQVGQEQLADYIGYRQTIIDMLLEIHDETTKDGKRFDESDIHNLFMPQYKTSDTSFHYANNVWIFDDKFMSYNYAASDKTIAKIVSDVTGKSAEEILDFQRSKKSDLVMLYSNPEDEYKDVLIIEFKRLNDGIDGKEKALTQLKKYPYYIEQNIDNIRSIFAYTIIDIDEEFETTLTKIEGFHKNSFGDKENKISSFYKYNDEVKAHINVVSFKQIIEDANKRNKVFLDILIQNFKSS